MKTEDEMKKICINKDWEFSAKEKHYRTDLPHTWFQEEDQYRGKAVYRKEICLEEWNSGEPWEKKAVFLELEAADHTAEAFVNGICIGIHKGGYSKIHFQIPTECILSGRLCLEIHVDNSPGEEVSPLAGDFTVFGGIYRNVSLLVAEPVHFDYLYYGTDGMIVRTELEDNGNGIVHFEPHVVGDGDKEQLLVRYSVLDWEGNVAARAEGAWNEPLRLLVPNVRCWDGKKDPCLYTVTAELFRNGVCVDRSDKKTGFRRTRLDSRTGFFLNGRRLFLKGVAKHQDFGGCFSAVSERERKRDFELIDEIGANAVRLSHYQHPEETYEQCDQDGYVVWAEIPMLKMTEKEAVTENAKQQLTELILQNIHHPSICFWGIQNEIGMFRDAPYMHQKVSELCALGKTLDPERLITCANLYPMKSSSMLNRLTDMVGYNIYFGWYYGKMQDYGGFLDRLHETLPDVPLGVSEYGVDAQTWLHSEVPVVKDYSEEFQSLFHETVYPLIEEREYLWGSFVWNMFDFSSARRDEGGQKYRNAKGLVTYDRSTRKDAFYYYKAKWSRTPFIHICEKRFEKRCAEQISLRVYTNLNEVTLTVKDQKLRGKNNGNGTVLFEGIPLEMGWNVFRVNGQDDDKKNLEDSVSFERTKEPEASYRLADSHAGETVQNWFLKAVAVS